ncbi:MarR family winged helix-turn-helix transcriptional regulator [Parahaliea aestuarii]|uniref:MarR family transcriptional regulator n=1 Tax=Parahaliea aestuarii TaxID=1852021 RepID=A0A5C8ZVK6_9GAMM|nr:MarR family transcriptional regulator [Parahaliea aestuarii]TXS91784.1 MarR family transcriptional regulator [Parahaliea aestuarii]
MDNTKLQDVYDNCACYRARALARRLTRDYDEALKPLGLKITQFTVLAVIQGFQPHSISQMAERLAMERTSLVRTLDLMARNGWITVGPEGFRRERSMQLTAEGVALLERALPIWKAAQQRFEARVDATRWQQFKDWFLEAAFG